MKKFENPMLEIEELNVADVIASSTACPEECEGYVECKREF